MSEQMELPIWKEKYDKMGICPHELYIRQSGFCWLKQVILPDGTVEIYCTDNKDKAITSCMLNPTIECVRCMINFAKRVIENGVENKRKSK